MTVEIMTDDLRTYLKERYADNFVSGCDRRVLEQMAWDIIYDQCAEWTDEDLMLELELHCPEILQHIKEFA